GGTERLGPRAQQPRGDGVEPGQPLVGDLAQRGQRLRPEVGPFEGPVVRGAGGRGDGCALRADVDLLALVDAPERAFAAHARPAAEVRAAHVLDRELLLLGQREERAGGRVGAVDEVAGHAVADEREEADLVGRAAQLVAEPLLVGGVAVEEGEVEYRDTGHGSRPFVVGCAGDETVRAPAATTTRRPRRGTGGPRAEGVHGRRELALLSGGAGHRAGGSPGRRPLSG